MHRLEKTALLYNHDGGNYFIPIPKARFGFIGQTLSVDGKCLKIRHGAQKLSETVFCRSLNPLAFSITGCKKSLCLIFALLDFSSTDYIYLNVLQ
ncbi:hypothetical protein QUF75_11360 [Desulfococcaceae bacterium HSG7]|nr:hypothetical protein [Desulfococcaceae bacterium HSG7]